MDKAGIRAIVVRNLAEVTEIDEAKVAAAQSVEELGASSLDVVEVISLTMRELKVKVPRTKLNDIRTLDQVVDLLHAAQEGALAPAGND